MSTVIWYYIEKDGAFLNILTGEWQAVLTGYCLTNDHKLAERLAKIHAAAVKQTEHNSGLYKP